MPLKNFLNLKIVLPNFYKDKTAIFILNRIIIVKINNENYQYIVELIYIIL